MGVGVWLGLAFVAALAVVLRLRWKSRGPIGAASAELRRLYEEFGRGADSPGDLAAWERALAALERYPSDYNKLDQELHVVRTFTAYLERHCPDDPRLESLRLIAGHRKNSIWGFTVKGD
jgi:tetrahydromethanopterin S-methyltransferase subunit B